MRPNNEIPFSGQPERWRRKREEKKTSRDNLTNTDKHLVHDHPSVQFFFSKKLGALKPSSIPCDSRYIKPYHLFSKLIYRWLMGVLF